MCFQEGKVSFTGDEFIANAIVIGFIHTERLRVHITVLVAWCELHPSVGLTITEPDAQCK